MNGKMVMKVYKIKWYTCSRCKKRICKVFETEEQSRDAEVRCKRCGTIMRNK
jgi:DNA-directed RNA polymerase subunit RPC12/RpoP